MAEEIPQFYPRDIQIIEGTRLIQANGYAANGESAIPFEGVQVATRKRGSHRRIFSRNLKGVDLSGITRYESHKMGFTRDNRTVVDTRRFGEWISREDYDRLTQK